MRPPDSAEPVFAEPWHAELFALTHALSSAGAFAWTDWAEHFAAALERAAEAGGSKDGSDYYEIWLGALEGFLVQRGLADAAGLADLKRDWTEAYLATPHGEPVALGDRTR